MKHPKWAEAENIELTRSPDIEFRRDRFTAKHFPDFTVFHEVVLDQAKEYGRCTGEWPICSDSEWVKLNLDNGVVYYRILDYDNYRGQYLCEAVDVEPD